MKTTLDTAELEQVPVRLKDVSKRFGDVEVLKSLQLEIAAGEFLTLLGPSGCGKSTTLNILAGLESPSEGKILIGDNDVTTKSPQHRDIAMVFQSYALYPHMTVFDNIAFPLRLKRRRLPATDVDSRVREVADALELTKLLNRLPGEISGGQRQRVALGRAVVRKPKVFLFDEPLSNLDNRLRVGMRSALKELHTSLKSTMVYVTHDQAEAMVMSDRIVVMNDGVVQQIGAPLELYTKPANVFVARFLGDRGMSILRGTLSAGGAAFESSWGRTSLPATFTSFGPVLLGVRPENLRVDNEGTLKGELKTIEPMGDSTYVRVGHGDEELTALAPLGFSEPIGSTVRLSVDNPSALCVFDPETTVRLESGVHGG